MMELLCSNYQPLKIPGTNTFESVFFTELAKSKSATFASGYISNDSIAELIAYYKDPDFKVHLNLIVGMHYFEGFTKPQYQSLLKLSEILDERNLGQVDLSVVSKYHGKLYSFADTDGNLTSIIGSSNLSRISSPDRVYESDVFINDQDFSKKIDGFLTSLRSLYCKPIRSISDIKIIEKYQIFDNHSDVQKIRNEELIEFKANEVPPSFNIPLKDTEKSNLNVYFGKGRESPTGLVIPRNWYEVELIVSNSITELEGYPEKGEPFWVITDDGFKFRCKTSGDYSKNFRSADDLKILGMWIKGRLEHNGCLAVGELITKDTFQKYGRDTITLTKTNIPNTWTLSFEVR